MEILEHCQASKMEMFAKIVQKRLKATGCNYSKVAKVTKLNFQKNKIL